ncbi:MAG: hypothetical protein ACRD68_18165, partial [Pyrinomonadaceae bacterium]
MTIPFETRSTVVEQIRSWRRRGERMSTIINRLLPESERVNALTLLRVDFCFESLPNFEVFPK